MSDPGTVGQPTGFSLDPVPPYRLDLTTWLLKRRPAYGVDVWDGERYQRVLPIEGRPVLISVIQAGAVDAPRLEVTASGLAPGGPARAAAAAAVKRLLGLQIDLDPFHELAARHTRLRELAGRFRGAKPPRFPSVWEAVVNAVCCQKISLHAGLAVLTRLASAYGPAIETPDGRRYAFPRPEDLARADSHALRALGLSMAKGLVLIELARNIAAGNLDLESLAGLSKQEAIIRLLQLRGVGRWTAEYTLLRGMGRIDLFPGDDVGARNGLVRWLHLREPLDYERVARITAKWKPYAGFIYFLTLLDGMERAGYLA